jgi:hypothetical protein
VLLSKLKNNESGVAMTMVMVLVAMVGGLAVYIFQTSDRLDEIADREMAQFDREVFETELQMILEKGQNCDLTLAGDGSELATFSKVDIQDPRKQEGFKVEVWTGSANKREQRKFKDGDRFHKMQIQTIRLFLDKVAGPSVEGNNTEMGTLKIKYSLRGHGQFMDLPLTVRYSTAQNGTSTFTGCRVAVTPGLCASVGQLFDEKSGQCTFPMVCDPALTLADISEETGWTGDREARCADNIGSHMRDIKFSQGIDEFGETNGMEVVCCYPKTMLSVRCMDIQEVADFSRWEGDREAACSAYPGGYLEGAVLSQGQQASTQSEFNGLMIRCCYPY